MEVLGKGLKVMDTTAISLCMDNELPIIVFDVKTPGNMRRVMAGDKVETLSGDRSEEVEVTSELIEDANRRMDKSLEVLQKELTAIRTGRASLGILDSVKVDYYGTPTP